MKNKIDKTLYTSLKFAEPEDIDYFIHLITDSASGRITLDSKIKENLIYAKNERSNKNYSEETLVLICKEFQNFAGNTIANSFRYITKSTYITYRDAVYDVVNEYKEFTHIKAKNQPLNKTVQQIALKALGNKWQNLTHKERLDKSNTSNFTSKTIYLTGFNLLNITGPAFRVTLPFIIQMGYIELKRIREKKTNQPQPLNQLEKTEHEISFSNSTQIKPEGISYQLDTSTINSLTQLLSNVPAAQTLYNIKNTEYVISSISFSDLTKVKGSETLARGITHGPKGIKEHTMLSAAEKLDQLALQNLIFSAASTLLAQKHLHDINEKLEKINNKLDDIQNTLDSKLHSDLLAIHNLIQKVMLNKEACLRDSHFLSEMTRQTVHIDSILMQINSSLTRQLDSCKNIDHTRFLASSTLKEIEKIYENLENSIRFYFIAIQTKIICHGLLYEAKQNNFHLLDIENLNSELEINNKTNEIIATIQSKIELTSSSLSPLSRKEYNKLLRQASYLSASIIKNSNESRDLYSLTYKTKPANLLLTIENGKLIEAELLKPYKFHNEIKTQ